MDVKITEDLMINGTSITLGQVAEATGTRAIVDNFSEMILGVANAHQLSQEQKDYIIEMLEDQLNIEMQCAMMLSDS